VDVQANKLNFSMAEKYLEFAKKQLDKLNTPNNELAFITAKANLLSKQERWKEAYELSLEKAKIVSNMVDVEKEISLNEMKIRFDAQFDQDKLEFLQKENLLQQKSIEQEQSKRRYLWGLVGLAALMLFLTYLAYLHQKKIKRYLLKLSQTDDLTGIANRRHIIDKLTSAQEQSIESKFHFAVAMIDLDHFKKINDTYGHAKGNDVLVHFAHCAESLVENIGHIGRLGGEEWLIVLPRHNAQDTQVFLQMLRHEYNQPLLLHLPKNFNLSFSSGVIICEQNHQSIDKILKIVDDSLYNAKDNGRNQDIYVYS